MNVPREAGADRPSFVPAEIASLASIGDRMRRALRFVAMLDRKLGAPAVLTSRPVIVGGSAVEFYTTGGYATQDIDIVIADPRPCEGILAASGFTRQGRYWQHAALDLLVEFPGRALTYGPGAYDRISDVDMGDGLSAAVIGIEDILIDRVHSGASEQRTNDLKWAMEMAALHLHRIDWDAVETLAVQNGPATVAAVEHIRARARHLGRNQP